MPLTRLPRIWIGLSLSENFSALETRCRNTWATRSSSATKVGISAIPSTMNSRPTIGPSKGSTTFLTICPRSIRLKINSIISAASMRPKSRRASISACNWFACLEMTERWRWGLLLFQLEIQEDLPEAWHRSQRHPHFVGRDRKKLIPHLLVLLYLRDILKRNESTKLTGACSTGKTCNAKKTGPSVSCHSLLLRSIRLTGNWSICAKVRVVKPSNERSTPSTLGR